MITCNVIPAIHPVIPAKAGIHHEQWIPAFAGMTLKLKQCLLITLYLCLCFKGDNPQNQPASNNSGVMQ